MDKEKVKALAQLARIEMPDEEAEKLTHEFESILNYVGEVKEASKMHDANEVHPVKNTMREDGKAHESGLHTEELLAASPDRDGDYIKVKQILS